MSSFLSTFPGSEPTKENKKTKYNFTVAAKEKGNFSNKSLFVLATSIQ
jgi:hypothetical protein